MPDLSQLYATPWFLPAVGVLALLIVWIIYRYLRGRNNALQRALDEISFERIEGLIIPNADEGEIQIDQLLLTSQGLLIVDIKDVKGVIRFQIRSRCFSIVSRRCARSFERYP
jgi:hypothetical protein